MLQNKYFRTKVHSGQWNFRHYSFPFDVQRDSFPKRLTWKVKAMTLQPLSPPSEHSVTYWSFFIKSLRRTETSCARQPESSEKHTHTCICWNPQILRRWLWPPLTGGPETNVACCGASEPLVLFSPWPLRQEQPLWRCSNKNLKVGSVFQSPAGFVWK